MKDVMIGICSACGKRHERPAPANVAVCAPNGKHKKPVEVVLTPAHPSVRFELRT